MSYEKKEIAFPMLDEAAKVLRERIRTGAVQKGVPDEVRMDGDWISTLLPYVRQAEFEVIADKAEGIEEEALRQARAFFGADCYLLPVRGWTATRQSVRVREIQNEQERLTGDDFKNNWVERWITFMTVVAVGPFPLQASAQIFDVQVAAES